MPVVFQVLLEFRDLFGGNVTRDVPAVFVTLMIVVRPLRSLAYDADDTLIHALDLGDLLQDGFGSGFRVHVVDIYVIDIYFATKKRGQNHKKKNFVSHPIWFDPFDAPGYSMRI
jgi:hypothetical protein